MSLTSFIVSRNWASSRLRILLTLVGVALGVAIVVAIYVMDFNTIQSRLVQQDPERGRVDLEVLPIAAEQQAAATRADLLTYDGVQSVATWRESRGVAVGLGVQFGVPGSVARLQARIFDSRRHHPLQHRSVPRDSRRRFFRSKIGPPGRILEIFPGIRGFSSLEEQSNLAACCFICFATALPLTVPIRTAPRSPSVFSPSAASVAPIGRREASGI